MPEAEQTGLWAKREKQIERVVNNTSQMYGDLQGLIGNSMPSIAALDLPALEEPIDQKESVVAEIEEVNVGSIPF